MSAELRYLCHVLARLLHSHSAINIENVLYLSDPLTREKILLCAMAGEPMQSTYHRL